MHTSMFVKLYLGLHAYIVAVHICVFNILSGAADVML